MSSVEQVTRVDAELTGQQRPRGTTSLVLGVAAVAAIGCPLLPDILSAWIRFGSVYLVVPLGIAAVITGVVALRRMQDQEGANRGRARAGVTLGTAAIVVPLIVIVWAVVALNQAYA